MEPLRLYDPVPHTLNQGFGENPDYYSKFKDGFGNPLKGHDGLDYFALHGTIVCAAHHGVGRYFKDSHGGEGILLRGLKQCSEGYPVTVYWHLIGTSESIYPSPFPTDGLEHFVQTGDILGYADNTGAPFESSGDHLHFALYFTDDMGKVLNQDNGFNGRVDPTKYLTGTLAHDVPQLITLNTKLISILQSIVGFLVGKK